MRLNHTCIGYLYLYIRTVNRKWRSVSKDDGPSTAVDPGVIMRCMLCIRTVSKNEEGLQKLRFFFDQRTIKEPSSETLLRLAELVLTLNCFSLADNHYKQVNGVAMGTKMGPSYANLFVGYIENQFFNQFNGTKPEPYGRYIDDCIGATSSSREELDHFITSVNSFHPALKCTEIYGNFRNFK